MPALMHEQKARLATQVARLAATSCSQATDYSVFLTVGIEVRSRLVQESANASCFRAQ